MNKNNLLMELMQLQFCQVELNLLLDTQPNCSELISQYNQVHQKLIQVKEKYDKTCTPLCNFGFSPNKDSYWQWAESPWPWEIKY